MKSPQGLYDLATEAGLGKEADDMVRRAGGESQKYLSGGFIMDTMDILNTFSYGMVGLVKGKGFVDGVKNRETMADDDALGQYGFAGKVAGFAADILLDPLTYVAPWKIVTKIPGVVKGGNVLKSKLLGELTTIEVDGQKLFHREGGWTPLTFAADKLIYGFAVDKSFLEGLQRTANSADAAFGDADKLIQALGKIDPNVFAKTVTKGPDGAMISAGKEQIDLLKRGLSPDEARAIDDVYAMRDNLMQQLIDLGVVSKETANEHWGTYLKQTYDEYLEAKGMFPTGKAGVGLDYRARKRELTPEIREKLGQVENASVLWGTTLLKQVDLIKKAKIQKYVAEGFALSDDMLDEYLSRGGKLSNLHKVDDSSRYSLRGKEFDIKKDLKTVHDRLKTVLKERRVAVKDDKNLTAELQKIEDQIEKLKGATEEEIGEALTGFKRVLREQSSLGQGPMKKAPTNAGQKALAETTKKWLNRGTKSDRLARETMSSADLWKEFKFTPEGIALSRAINNPKLMYQWKSEVEFLDAVRYPDKAEVFTETADYLADISDAQQLARIAKAEKNVRKIGELEQTRGVLKDTNLVLVKEAVDRLENEYADLLWQKSGILDSLEMNKMGQLAGKYIPKDVWDVIKGTYEPSKEIGESLIMTFKHAKVIWNPASHVRNSFSAGIQNWWKMGLGPWRLDTYYDAVKEFHDPGSKVLAEMRELGFNERSGYINELLSNYLTNKDLLDKTLAHQIGERGAVKKFGRDIDRLMMKSYAHVDNVAKVAAYKHGLKQGLSKEDAFRQAMAATFNYSEVTPFVQRMRKAIWGVPFVTFALKAVPLAAETLAKNPGRISVFGKARNDLFAAAGIEGNQEAEAMPDYMRDDMFVMRLPWKDDMGRSMYFDLSYIVPFGALADGSYLKNPISANPVLQLVRELSRNETFSGSKIFNESDDIDTVLGDITIHIGKMGLPPFITDFIPDGYDSEGVRKPAKMGWDKFARTNTQDLGPGERSFYQEMFRMLGVGALPYNVTSKESALAYTQKENLSKLLTENGVMKMYTAGYLPEDSPLRPENQMNAPTNLYDKEVRPYR